MKERFYMVAAGEVRRLAEAPPEAVALAAAYLESIMQSAAPSERVMGAVGEFDVSVAVCRGHASFTIWPRRDNVRPDRVAAVVECCRASKYKLDSWERFTDNLEWHYVRSVRKQSNKAPNAPWVAHATIVECESIVSALVSAWVALPPSTSKG